MRNTCNNENNTRINWFKKATNLHPKLKQHLQEGVYAGQVPT